jgi:exonuclease SbcD
MIRILHFADLHLGIENYGRLDPETGLSSRAGDFLRAFDDVIQHALTGDDHGPVDLVLFAGDAFKTRDPNPTYQREFARRIHRLAIVEQIPVFLLVGNHDMPNAAGHADSLDIFRTLEVPGVTVARRPDLFTVATRQGPLQIIALPWVTRSTLLAREDFKSAGLDEINALMLERLQRIVDELLTRCDPSIPTLMTVHGSVQGAVFGSERSVMLGYDLLLPRSLVDHPQVSYVALGHIHKHQCVLDVPPVVYAGSPERIDFGEAKEDKGFVWVEISGAGVPATWRFQARAARPFVHIDVEADRGDPTETVLTALSRRSIDDAIVRVVIHTTPELEPHIDYNQIHKALAPALHVAGVVPDVRRPARLRLSGDTASVEALQPREALERYFLYRQVAPERLARLLQCADSIMSRDESTGGDP